MNCQQVQESLGDHSVGLLDGAILTDFERHVAICAECSHSVRQFQRCMELLNHATLPPPPPNLWSGVHARLELDRTISSYSNARPAIAAPRTFWSGTVAAMAGFAAAALIMASLNGGWTGSLDGGRDAGAAMASVPPMAVSVSQHNGMEPSSPVADGASIIAVDAVTMRPMSGAPRQHQTILPGREILGEPAVTLDLMPRGMLMGEGAR